MDTYRANLVSAWMPFNPFRTQLMPNTAQKRKRLAFPFKLDPLTIINWIARRDMKNVMMGYTTDSTKKNMHPTVLATIAKSPIPIDWSFCKPWFLDGVFNHFPEGSGGLPNSSFLAGDLVWFWPRANVPRWGERLVRLLSLRKVRGVDLLLVFIPPGSELMQAKARRVLDGPCASYGIFIKMWLCDLLSWWNATGLRVFSANNNRQLCVKLCTFRGNNLPVPWGKLDSLFSNGKAILLLYKLWSP